MTLIFEPAPMIVGANVAPSVGSKSAASAGSVARMLADRALRVGRVLAEGAQQRARLVDDVVGGAAGAEALQRGR